MITIRSSVIIHYSMQHCFAGCLDLIYTGLGGKIEGLQMMTKVETGSHMGMSLVHCQKVSAMILEPVSTGAAARSCRSSQWFQLLVAVTILWLVEHPRCATQSVIAFKWSKLR